MLMHTASFLMGGTLLIFRLQYQINKELIALCLYKIREHHISIEIFTNCGKYINCIICDFE